LISLFDFAVAELAFMVKFEGTSGFGLAVARQMEWFWRAVSFDVAGSHTDR
jgi:hypothetical protein